MIISDSVALVGTRISHIRPNAHADLSALCPCWSTQCGAWRAVGDEELNHRGRQSTVNGCSLPSTAWSNGRTTKHRRPRGVLVHRPAHTVGGAVARDPSTTSTAAARGCLHPRSSARSASIILRSIVCLLLLCMKNNRQVDAQTPLQSLNGTHIVVPNQMKKTTVQQSERTKSGHGISQHRTTKSYEENDSPTRKETSTNVADIRINPSL